MTHPAAPVYSSPPDWFMRAVGHATTSHWTESGDVRIHYRAWNAQSTGKTPLLLVHGYRGHTHWWDAIAPYLTDHCRVFAMDLSGMGLSDRRKEYSGEGFVNDVVNVLRAIGDANTVLVGHSYGGTRAMRACAAQPGLVGQMIIVDAPLRFPDLQLATPPRPLGTTRAFAEYETLRARYRLVPEQPVLQPDLLEHIAFHSIARGADGFRWMFDPALPIAPHGYDDAIILQQIEMPTDFIYGELSRVYEPKRLDRAQSVLGVRSRSVIIPEAHHHIMLDQPLALIASLRALLA